MYPHKHATYNVWLFDLYVMSHLTHSFFFLSFFSYLGSYFLVSFSFLGAGFSSDSSSSEAATFFFLSFLGFFSSFTS